MSASKSKKDLLREAVSQPPKQLTTEEREDLGKNLLGSKAPSFQKALFSIEVQDLEWLDTTVATLKRTRRRSNKSELIKLGIALMKEKSLDELKELLKRLD